MIASVNKLFARKKSDVHHRNAHHEAYRNSGDHIPWVPEIEIRTVTLEVVLVYSNVDVAFGVIAVRYPKGGWLS